MKFLPKMFTFQLEGPADRRILPWLLEDWNTRICIFHPVEQLRIFLRGGSPFVGSVEIFNHTLFQNIMIYSDVQNIVFDEHFLLHSDGALCYSLPNMRE